MYLHMLPKGVAHGEQHPSPPYLLVFLILTIQVGSREILENIFYFIPLDEDLWNQAASSLRFRVFLLF